MEGRREGKKGAHACMGGCTCWETVRVCVDNRVHDSTWSVLCVVKELALLEVSLHQSGLKECPHYLRSLFLYSFSHRPLVNFLSNWLFPCAVPF